MGALAALNPYLWKYRGRLFLGFVFVFLTNAFAVFAPVVIGEGVNALEVRWINTGRAEGRAAKRAGLKKGDIIIGMENKPLRLTSQQFNMHVKLNYEVGDKLPLTLLRNGKRIQFDWPLTDSD